MKADAMVEQVVQQWPLDRLREYANNPRQNDDAVEQTAAAINAFGFRVPILARSDGEIVDGHLRLKAAWLLGMDTVPVLLADDLTEAQVRAFRISVNKVADLATWDMDKLAAELDSLRDVGFDLPVIGFSTQELNDLIGTPNTGFDPDEVPPAPVVPVSRAGDLWVMGAHRLLCGDSTKPEDVARLMGGAKADMVFTDPPYGVAYRDTGAGTWNAEKLAKKKAGTLKPRFDAIEGDDQNEQELFDFLVAYLRVQVSHLADGAAQYVCHASLRAHVFREALLATGYAPRAELIWAKSRPGFNFANYKHQHEPIYYAAPVKGPCNFYGDQTQTTLWTVASESGSTYQHPTQKPAGLAQRAIENSARHGECVYDPFLGSGTTIIAAEMTGRACYALEIAPQYVDVSVLRWQLFTGRDAVHNDGRTFEEVRAERCQALQAA